MIKGWQVEAPIEHQDTDVHTATIEAVLATGDYASASEIMRAALRGFFDDRHVRDQARIDADVAAYRAARGRGVTLHTLLFDDQVVCHVIHPTGRSGGDRGGTGACHAVTEVSIPWRA